jgi:branched-chain amino acid transport system ATP-binding protein
MGEPILRVDGVGVSFGGLKAVEGVSFEAHRCSVTSVIGPNGAGKSTLFNLISGAVRPQSGHVVFDGNDITGLSPNQICRMGLARSFQISNLFFDLTVQENLRLACHVNEPGRHLLLPLACSKAVDAKVDALLDRFALVGQRMNLVGNLSHGEQRRLEIAVALGSEPGMLLLDEPTQGMSHGDTEDTKRAIQDLSRNVAVLLVEHDIELVMGISDWVVVMHQGKKLAEGDPDTVRANRAVREAYLGGG